MNPTSSSTALAGSGALAAPSLARGTDVFRVVDDKIVEVWLIGEDQPVEDAFWS